MSKRLLSAGIWSFAALYAGSILHGVVGTSELLGPIVGLTTAGLIVSDPIARLRAARSTSQVPVERATPGFAADLA